MTVINTNTIQKTVYELITRFAIFYFSKKVKKNEEITTLLSRNRKNEVEYSSNLYRHRNWINVADGAYTKQVNLAI